MRRNTRPLGNILAALIVAALCAACATDGNRSPGASASAAQIAESRDSRQPSDIVNGAGLLWRVDVDGRRPSYVFGTLHLSDPRIVVLPPPVEDAFQSSVAVGFEHVLPEEEDPDTEAMMRLSSGRDLEQIVGPDLFEAIYVLGENEEEFKAEVRTMKPWAAAMLVEQVVRAPGGEPVLDDRLEIAAREAGKTVFGLETPIETMEAFDRLPEMHQIDFLRANLLDLYLPSETIDAVREAEIRAYLARDTAWLVEQWNAMDDVADTTTRRFYDHLLNERSGRFAERMVPWIDEGGAFVAVGSGHLPGERGVIALLRDRGYDVTRVY